MTDRCETLSSALLDLDGLLRPALRVQLLLLGRTSSFLLFLKASCFVQCINGSLAVDISLAFGKRSKGR